MNSDEERLRKKRLSEFNKRAHQIGIQMGLYPGRLLGGRNSQGLPSDHPKVVAYERQLEEERSKLGLINSPKGPFQ